MINYDVIVVGARCGGSPTAMLLAQKGYRVLLLDKSRFPSDVLSAHYIHHTGVGMLEKWGLLERVAACGCPPIYRLYVDLGEHLRSTIDYEKGAVEFNGCEISPPPISPRRPAYAPRRRFLDTILLESAIAGGAQFRESFTVKDLIFDHGRVTGVVGSSESGTSERIHGRIVVGADGRYSTMNKILNPITYHETPSHTIAAHSYWSGLDLNGMEAYFREGICAHVTPTNDGLACVGLSVARDRCESNFMHHLEDNFYRYIGQLPELKKRLENGKREESFVGTDFIPNYIRRCFGDGWALIGDAAYNRDPIMGQGISEAFRQAELLAKAIDETLSGERPTEEALRDYQDARDRFAIPMFNAAAELSQLKAPNEETFSMMRMFDSQFALQQENQVVA